MFQLPEWTEMSGEIKKEDLRDEEAAAAAEIAARSACSSAAADILRRLLHFDPAKRAHAVRHLAVTAFYKDFNFDHVMAKKVNKLSASPR